MRLGRRMMTPSRRNENPGGIGTGDHDAEHPDDEQRDAQVLRKPVGWRPSSGSGLRV